MVQAGHENPQPLRGCDHAEGTYKVPRMKDWLTDHLLILAFRITSWGYRSN
jgi:hypothetical protein